MSRADFQALYDEIVAILESEASPSEKVERLEAVVFEPTDASDESDSDADGDDED